MNPRSPSAGTVPKGPYPHQKGEWRVVEEFGAGGPAGFMTPEKIVFCRSGNLGEGPAGAGERPSGAGQGGDVPSVPGVPVLPTAIVKFMNGDDFFSPDGHPRNLGLERRRGIRPNGIEE